MCTGTVQLIRFAGARDREGATLQRRDQCLVDRLCLSERGCSCPQWLRIWYSPTTRMRPPPLSPHPPSTALSRDVTPPTMAATRPQSPRLCPDLLRSASDTLVRLGAHGGGAA